MGGYFVFQTQTVRHGWIFCRYFWSAIPFCDDAMDSFQFRFLVADVSNTMGKEGETVGDSALSLHVFLDTRKA